MYHAELGQFITRDPLPQQGEPDVLYDNNWFGEWLDMMRNLYGYTNNSPVNRVDPLGLFGYESPLPIDYSGQGEYGRCYPSRKEQCERAIKETLDTIAAIVRLASNGKDDSFADAVKSAKAWANAGGYESQELQEQPDFFKQAVRDIESSNWLTAASGLYWWEDWLLSSLPWGNSGWDTGNGDVWLRMEAFRSNLLLKRLKVLCKDALKQ